MFWEMEEFGPWKAVTFRSPNCFPKRKIFLLLLNIVYNATSELFFFQ